MKERKITKIFSTIFFGLVLAASLLTAQLIVDPGQASAMNPPRCKVQTFGASSTEWGSCKDVVQYVPGFTFADDKCYIVTLGSPSSAMESGCSGPKCNVQSLVGGAVGNCPDLAPFGVTPLPGRCYNVTLGTAAQIQEVACNNTPFSENIAALDGTVPTGGTGEPTTSNGTPTGETPATQGSAPTAQENAETPQEQLNIKREGGFEEVDANCNVGNQGRGCGITDKLSTIANVLSAGVGIVIVIVVIVGGIQYMTAGGDPQRVAAAKMRIINAMIALVAFFFLYSFLQWIVPGGIF